MNRAWLVTGLLITSFCFVSSGATADEADKEEKKMFTGTWNNRKYNSSGPLKCVAKPGEEKGDIVAIFTGTFQNDPFEYKVTFQAKPGRGQTDLSGKATISGHIYNWTGSLKGGRLRGKYLGTNQYNGEFVLNEVKEK